MEHQPYPYFDHIFSKSKCGFRAGYNTQQFLLSIIEKLRISLDEAVMQKLY